MFMNFGQVTFSNNQISFINNWVSFVNNQVFGPTPKYVRKLF